MKNLNNALYAKEKIGEHTYTYLDIFSSLCYYNPPFINYI